MFNDTFLTKDPLVLSFIDKGDYSNAAKIMIEDQKLTWYMLAAGYQSLNLIKTKTINFKGFSFIIQFNPGRILSTSALTDEKSIRERACFLCNENRPVEQKGILFNNYLILANPFPVFPEHFTISCAKHTDQKINGNFGNMLDFSRLLSEYYSVFYNGPKSGASAPDHMHFQAGTKSAMPINNEYSSIKKEYGEILVEHNNVSIFGIDDGLRRIISFEGSDKDKLIESFNSFYDLYTSGSNGTEPLMNIIASYEEKRWNVFVMLRAKHRPEEYFMKGNARILFSPGGTDFGGLCITPLEKDFDRFNKELLVKIFNEVSISREVFNGIINNIKVNLN